MKSSLKQPLTVVSAATCKCRFCERCAKKLGEELSKKLRIAFALMQHIQMWTLTVDPKRFESPQEAWRYVSDQKIIARLVSDLRRRGVLLGRHYMWVLEFHESGWPHWHIVLNAKFIEKQVFQEIWNRIGTGDRNENFGYVAFSRGRSPGKRGKFANARHAACYVTKYITKAPRQGWPQWLLKYSGQCRRYQTSQGMFKELGDVPSRKEKKYSRDSYTRRKTIQARINKCGDGFRIFVQKPVSGWQFAGELPHKVDDFQQFFMVNYESLALPDPGCCPYADMLFWSWLGKSTMPRGRINSEGHIEPCDWSTHPDLYQDQLDKAPPPFACLIATSE